MEAEYKKKGSSDNEPQDVKKKKKKRPSLSPSPAAVYGIFHAIQAGLLQS